MRSDAQVVAERVILAIGLPISGLIGCVLACIPMAVGASRATAHVTLAALVPLTMVCAAWGAPKLVPCAAGYSVQRRVAAGLAGLVAGVVVGRALVNLGLQPDALSQLQSGPWQELVRAGAHEAGAFLVVCGTLGAVAFVALGTPRSSEPRAGEPGHESAEARKGHGQ